MSEPLVEFRITILRDGSVVNDVLPHGSSFADVYRGMIAIREEVDRQIRERRECPYNPRYGDGGESLGEDAVVFDLRPRGVEWLKLTRLGQALRRVPGFRWMHRRCGAFSGWTCAGCDREIEAACAMTEGGDGLAA